MGAGATAGGALAADMPGSATPRVCFGATCSSVGEEAGWDQGEALTTSLTPMGAPFHRPTAGLRAGDSAGSDDMSGVDCCTAMVGGVAILVVAEAEAEGEAEDVGSATSGLALAEIVGPAVDRAGPAAAEPRGVDLGGRARPLLTYTREREEVSGSRADEPSERKLTCTNAGLP